MQIVIQRCFGDIGSLTVGRSRSNPTTHTIKCRKGVLLRFGVEI
jgi:hypothetical protein